MKLPIVAILLVLCLGDDILAQPVADILWNRFQAGSAVGLQLAVSRTTRSIYTLGTEWNCLQLLPGRNSIENQFDRNHSGTSPSVLVRHDSEIIAVGQTILSWNYPGNEFTSLFPLNSADYRFIDATSDGNLIAIVDVAPGNVLYLFDRVTQKKVMSWDSASGAIGFSPDGKSLLASINHSLILIDVPSMKVTHHYSNVFNTVASLAWSPTRPGVFAEDASNGVVEMDTSGHIRATWDANPGIGPNTLAYSPDGSVIAAAGPGHIDLLNPTSKSLSSIDAPLGAWFLCFLNNDTLVVTSFADVSLYSISKHSYLGSLNGHNWTVKTLGYSGDGQTLVSGSKDHTVIVWEAASGIRKRVLQTPIAISCLAVSRDASTIIGSQNDSLLLWTNGSESHEVLLGHTGEISSIVFSPDDTSFVSTSFEGETFEWSLNSRQIVNRYTTTTGGNIVCYSHTGSMLAGTDKNSFAIWDRNTQQKITQFRPAGLLLSASFAADDQHLILGCSGPNQFEIHPISSDSPSVIPYVITAYLNGMAIFPDNRHMLAVHEGSGLQINDITTGQIQSIAQHLSQKVYSAAVNPVTGDFASGFDDGTIVVWKAPNPSSSVKQAPGVPVSSLNAFATSNHISIRLTAPQSHSRIMVYSIDGRYVYSSEVQGLAVETGPLANGVYFVVLVNERGERAFRKVSLFGGS